ncbi:exportin-2-like [Ptychodera flava]|uniref:exportin-2-like n=1 Tax=Ptychodera flava TaxID=63121 RepID=UPI00396A3971
MEINEGNLQTLATFLQKTLSSDINERRPAEKYLESVEGHPGYPILLLHLLGNADAALPIRVSASITFKNYIKRNWRIVEDVPNKVSDGDRETIKKEIVGMMLKMPEQIQRQLSDAISIIGREDFPHKWPNLLPDMVSMFKSGDFHMINGVLQTAHSLFKRYRHEFKSQELWTEIKHVLDNFAAPLTELFVTIRGLAVKHANEAQAIKILYSSLTLISKVFYSLNFQDLPEYFEDHMETWMTHFHSLLVTDNKLLHTDDESEAGPLERLRSQICDNVALYAQKYDEEFQRFLPNFVKAVWDLLVSTTQAVKYDLLVSNAILFLASVAERAHYKELFESQDTLNSICKNVVIDNMYFRDADEELFEDNPEEYIRRDIEGSDIDTRRRAASDLVRALCKFFEHQVTQIFSHYVSNMLQEYAKDPAKNWKDKDVAIYLVTSIAAKSKTQKHGTTQTSELVNVGDFFNGNIIPDLQSANVNEVPVLKGDALKFVITFRNQLSPELLTALIPYLIKLLTAESVVVHTYAAMTLERIFTIKAATGGPVISVESLKPHVEQLLLNLFNTLNHPGSAENEYVMKAIMRSFSMMQGAITPYIPILLSKLTEKLMVVSKNPSKPHFNHYLFECISLSVKICCKAEPKLVSSFEEALFPPFQGILQADVQEFMPYVFQIMSMMLEIHDDVPPPYMALFPHLLVPLLWERLGNIPALVRLLQAFVEKGSAAIIESDKLTGLLGVFQKLIASKSNDHEGFYLVNSLVEHMKMDDLQKYVKEIFLVLFKRLQSSKTTKYVKHLLVFFSLYAYKCGGPSLIAMIDTIQPKMFGMVVERLYLQDVQKVSGGTERKICAVGITKILTECPQMIEGDYAKLWPQLLQALIGLFELPEDESTPDDEHFIEIEDTPGYQTAFSQLVFAGKREHDPFHGTIPNAKIYLAQSLQKMSATQPGKLQPLISASLPAEAAQFLQGYMTAAGVTLA